MNKIKVIFDTDPGVDDAMALLFLYYAPEIELIGITTTHGNGTIATTTHNALYLTERFGIDLPVAQGSGAPLAGAAADPPVFVHGHNGLGDIPLPQNIAKKTDSRPAYRFIIDMVRAHAQEVAIVAVGPLTTLALALRNDPEIAGLVRRLVIMGGAFGHHGHLGNVTPAAEANILSDPHAADETLGGSWPITMVGLDVTQQTLMTTEFLKTSPRREVRPADSFGKLRASTRPSTIQPVVPAFTSTIRARSPISSIRPCSPHDLAQSASSQRVWRSAKRSRNPTVTGFGPVHGMATHPMPSARTSIRKS